MRSAILKGALDLAALSIVRLLVLAMEVTPEFLGMCIARICVHGLVLAMPRSRRVALRNLKIAFPECSSEEGNDIYRRSLEVLARNLYAFARMPRLTRRAAEEKVDYGEVREFWRRSSEVCEEDCSKTGILVATAHYGCFELFVQMHALLVRPISILARGFDLPRLDSWCNERRSIFGNDVFSRKGGYREIVSRLNGGRDVVVLCDQNVKRNHATFVDFFGLRAATTKAIGTAALRTGARVVLAVAVEIVPERFEVILRELKNPRELSGNSSEKIMSFTREMNQALEDVIRQHPEQWFWVHRRWKTRPHGEKENLYS
ncbi:MAG: lysophospholipid acyltransferase family protein [Deltaproteobacteria bacterium]|nr:lysophospholipid acyltransferase family protein [Deltaproteobacteria bacterium]